MHNKRHAFLIIAHKNDLVLQTLISMIDHPRNDIIIHMDAKASNYDEKFIESFVSDSNIYHTKRTKVSWGGYSQINVELLLLRLATDLGCYQYYHLVSGADLLIQPQEVFHSFFDKNDGKEFIRFQQSEFVYESRVELFHLFQEKIGRGVGSSAIVRGINYLFLKVQKFFHVKNKCARAISFQKGTNWFSITDGLARFVLKKKEWIERVFKYSKCGDEVFLQTIVVNSSFREKLYHTAFDNDCNAIMRLIDWKRGNPYIFRKTDYEELSSSTMMFARKFDSDVDREIIEMISYDINSKR